ncbi:M48 family metallopeptidase [Cyanobacterium aponinum UTEX 3221]|uniref:M48 family metalloprotease n=1 Tax=Cyanobacterium aponinum 0216 TaxID=2676140 RepID=A0A844GZF0_9CHRO|nr:M48 family metallopeptidase [Cyanobacterium aponinum]MTF40179.1 M48 family metalloprotease [Cyanobacterium aponinum 0216]WRL37174.1 M48 family metallopeptidase [Cyanobacterium aponinum UTEX 3221]
MSFKSPIIENKNPEPNKRQLLTIFFLFGGTLTFLIFLIFYLFNQLIYLVPLEVEEKIGNLIIEQIAPEKENSNISQQLNVLVDEIETLLPNKNNVKRNYEVIYVPENTVNALAIPGNKIVVYEGLLKELKSENELVMILGHEIGHFAHRDHLRSLGNMLLFKLIISSIIGDLDIFSSGVDLANVIVNTQYSQRQEMKADEFGLDILNKYYGHVGGAIAFFETLEKKENNSNKLSFFSSHPSPQNRIKNLRKIIEKKDYIESQPQELNILQD